MLREKVTKLAKIMFTGLTMALCVTALNPAVTAKAEDMLQESEPNGNPATANQLPLNTWVKGIPSDNYDEDWYQFTIQNPGESHIEIRPDASVSNGSCNWDVTLYDANRRELRSWYDHSWSDYQFGWTPGKYYIRITQWTDMCTYNLKVNYTPSNQWEKERYYGEKNLNNANIISLNKQYTGNLYDSYDVDYYRIRLKGTNGISLKFLIDDTVANPGRWQIEFIEYKSRKSLGYYRVSTNETLTIPRCSGDLLIKISNWNGASLDLYHIQATSKLSATEITSLKGGTHSANLRWKKVSNATGYYIYRSTSENGYYKKVATVKGKTSYTDKKSLKKSGYYYYKIVAYRKSGSKTLKSAPTSASYTYVY